MSGFDQMGLLAAIGSITIWMLHTRAAAARLSLSLVKKALF